MAELAEVLTVAVLRSGIRLATPIALAAIGDALCFRAEVLNFALEGMMLFGAFTAIVAAFLTGDTYLGVAAAVLGGGLIGAIFALVYLRYRVDLVILAIPLLDLILILGGLLSGHNLIVYTAWPAAAAGYVVLFRTKFCRHIRAVGENQAAAEAVGINVSAAKFFVLVASGSLATLGGAFSRSAT